MVVYYSLGNRKYWFTTVERLMEIAELLSKKSYYLYDIDAIQDTYNGWFILNEDYVNTVSKLIEEVSEELEDEKILSDLMALKEVFEGGSVIFG